MFNPNLPWHQSPSTNPRQPRRPRPQSRTPIVIDSESDDDNVSRQPPHNNRYSHSPSTSTLQHQQTWPPPPEQEKKYRSRLREERHAALCVLMDRELLTIQALAAQETIPQARRRFLSTLLSPSDPTTASLIRADQFTVPVPFPASASTSVPVSPSANARATPSPNPAPGTMVVSRRIVDVCDIDDSGWYRPVSASEGEAGSPVSVGKMRGSVGGSGSSRAGTPERGSAKGKGRSSSGRYQQQQQPQQQTPRERRRRWSEAERQDFGVGMGGNL
ncbi:hypothetical protein BJX70DRAFT_92558 [Aspergillus crustosus]